MSRANGRVIDQGEARDTRDEARRLWLDTFITLLRNGPGVDTDLARNAADEAADAFLERFGIEEQA